MKKKITVFIILLISSDFLFGQSSYLKLIEKGKYAKVEKKINKAMIKEPKSVELNFAMAILLINRKYSGYNASKSYEYLTVSKNIHSNIFDDKSLKSLNKIPINLDIFYNYTDTICRYALDDAIAVNSVEIFDRYIDFYKNSPVKYIEKAITYRFIAAFTIAMSENTVESFQFFISKYPDAPQLKQATIKRNALAFEIVKQNNNIPDYKEFTVKYPDAIEISEAWIRIHDLAYTLAESVNTASSFKTFIDEYPKSKQFTKAVSLYEEKQFLENTVVGDWESYKSFIMNYPNHKWNTAAIDSIVQLGISLNNVKALKYSVLNCSKSQKDQLIPKYYSIISKDGELSTLETFKTEFADYYQTILSFNTDYECALMARDIGLSSSMDKAESNDEDELNKRLKREGAKTGSIQISLLWNNYNDLDLHCIDPNGEEIYFENPTSSSKGELDVDMNANGPESNQPVENIYWEKGTAPEGIYKIMLNHYSNHGCGYGCKDPTNYFIRIKYNNTIKEFRGSISHQGNSRFNKKLIFSFNFKNIPFGDVELTLDNTEKLNTYIKKSGDKELAFVALQRLISKDLLTKNWSNAIVKINNLKPYFYENKKVDDLIDIISKNSDNSIKIHPIASINSIEGGEYSPIISADNKYIYFCGNSRNDNIGLEDIFYSHHDGIKWSAPIILSSLSHPETNDAPMGISTDRTSIIQFVNGKLGISNKTSENWSEINYFPESINSGNWSGDAMISSDGNALIFSSVRSTNYNYSDELLEEYHASNNYFSDIYVSLKNGDNWLPPINLGLNVNSFYSERSPFLHPDMKTLYFSSDGLGGMGKYDVFKSTRLADSCWNCWSKPINLGKEINTEESDWGYKISTDGENAYFSKKKSANENEDIFSLNLPSHLRPDFVATVSGKLLDKQNKPISAEIKWEDLQTGKSVGQSKSDPTDGSYFIVLPLGKIYGYYIDKNEYFPLSNNLDLRTNNSPIQLSSDITITTFNQMIDEGVSVPVNNLFFEFGKFNILPLSIPELKRIALIIKTNNLKVEIIGHTDNIGDDKSNLFLSDLRAKSVKDFLINEGCDASLLTPIGFGCSQPLTTNETEEGRAKNRRVELKFIK